MSATAERAASAPSALQTSPAAMTVASGPSHPSPAASLAASAAKIQPAPLQVPTGVTSSPSPVAAPATGAASELPSGCALVKPHGGVAVVICQSSSEDVWAKLAPNVPSVLLSLIAVGLSVYSLRTARAKDERARTQSIQDDFWLRKVVSPVSIEPLVKFGTALLANLPDHTSDRVAANAFGAEKLQELRAHTEAFRTLLLISEGLFAEVEPLLEQVEDRLAEYMGALEAHWSTQTPAPSRPEAVADLSARLMAVLGPIKSHQAAVGAVN